MTTRTATCSCTIEDGRIVQCSLCAAAPTLYEAVKQLIQLVVIAAFPRDDTPDGVVNNARAAIRAADGPPKCPHGAPSLDQGLYCSQPSCEICRARKGSQ